MNTEEIEIARAKQVIEQCQAKMADLEKARQTMLHLQVNDAERTLQYVNGRLQVVLARLGDAIVRQDWAEVAECYASLTAEGRTISVLVSALAPFTFETGDNITLPTTDNHS